MSEEKNFIDWGKIVTNAVSAVVTMIVVSACLILWRGATTVDEKVNEAMTAAQQQNQYLREAVDLLQEEFREQKRLNNQLMQAIEDLKEGKKEKITLKPVEIPERNYIQQRLPDLRPPASAR